MAELVSVVIPTYRRPKLVMRAVSSVLEQTYRDVEAVVVIDGVDPEVRQMLEGIGDPRVRVIETEINKGPSNARNIGVDNARGEYVAFLDDDDEWLSGKIERQVALVASEQLKGKPFIVSCRLRATAGKDTFIWPTHLYQPGEDFSEYLIDRPTLFGRPGIVHTSSILVPRSLALQVRFPDDKDHEDWTWLLKCVAEEKAEVRMCEEALSYYHLQMDVPSRAKQMDWKFSYHWAITYRHLLSPRAFSALLATKVAMKAKQQKEFGGLVTVARALLAGKQVRPSHWIQFAGIALAPTGLSSHLRVQSFNKG
jgi:glycosyltransferase involved in cell wall biosynthesis